MPDDATAFVPLKPVVLHILLALATGPLHGYAIIRNIRDRTGGLVQVHTGPLYRHLRRLLDDGLIQEVDDPPGAGDDPRRGAFYALTDLGRQVMAVELGRLRTVLDLGRDLGVV